MEHPTEQPLATLLESGHLEGHQASPENKLLKLIKIKLTKGLSMVVLVKEVASRQVDPVCAAKSGLRHGLAASWPRYCQLWREGRQAPPPLVYVKERCKE